MLSTQEKQLPWWKTSSILASSKRLDNLRKIQDPGTSADEVLRGSHRTNMILLAFSAVLGFLTIQRSFETTLPYWLSIGLASALVIPIEWGKFWCAKEVVRTLYHRKINLRYHAEEGVVFIALFLVTVATFGMSVRNSTIGSQRLAVITGHEKNDKEFQSNTNEFDEQIAVINRRIAENQKIKWKGTVTWKAQKAIDKDVNTLNQLMADRKAERERQLNEFNKDQQFAEENTSNSSSLILAIGGWVEALQVLLIILMASCEKILLRRESAGGSTPGGGSTSGSKKTEGYKSYGSDYASAGGSSIMDNGYEAKTFSISPTDVELTDDDYYLFKQTGDLFKQILSGEGKVIGLEYKGPRMEEPMAININDVRSRISSYQNNKGRTPESRKKNVELWTFALSLFQVENEEVAAA